MASSILVKDIKSKDVKVVRPDTSVQEVVATLNKFHISSVVVIQKGKPVGIITIRDILVRIVEQYIAPKGLTAGQIMIAVH
jgi:CBS domain-containing protein